jgi:hypothetical protein
MRWLTDCHFDIGAKTMTVTAAAAPQEPWQFVGMNADGLAVYETGPGAVDEEIPPPPVDFDEMHAEIKARAIENNARQAKPFAVCKGCGWPTHPEDRDPFWRSMCLSCGTTRNLRLLLGMARKWGKRAARARFLALARIEPCVDVPAVPITGPVAAKS